MQTLENSYFKGILKLCKELTKVEVDIVSLFQENPPTFFKETISFQLL